MKYNKIYLTLCGMITMSSLNASDMGAVVYPADFNNTVNAILDNNTDLSLTRERDNAEVWTLKSENQLSDPEISFSHDWGMKQIGNKWSLGISQGFDWPGLYKARNEEARKLDNALSIKQKENIAETRLQVRLALLNYIGTLKQLKVDQELLEHFNMLIERYSRPDARGEMSIIDLNKLRVEQASASRKVSEDKAALNDAVSALELLNGGRHCHELIAGLTEYPEHKKLVESDYKAMAEHNNPETGYLSAMSEVAARKVKNSSLERMPGFSLGYIYSYELGDRFNGISVGLTLPIYSNKSKKAAAIIDQQSYETEAENTVRKNLAQISHNFRSLEIIEDELSTLKPIMDDDNVMRLLDKAREGGEMNLLTYIQEVTYFVAAKQDYVTLEKEYHLILAKLNKYMD